jgi:hypothetical protein
MHRALVPIALVLSSVTGGCSANPGPKPCRSSATCSGSESCVMGACSPGTAPVTASTKRFVLEPDSLAFVYSDGDTAERPVAAFGADVGARARLLVRFPHPEISGTIERAWLVLSRAPGASAGPGDVTLRAESIDEPWSLPGGSGTGWSTPPRSSSIATATTVVGPRGPSSIRIDVTPWAQNLVRKGPRPWGLRVEAKGSGYGVPIATGAGAGAPPVLELYVQP